VQPWWTASATLARGRSRAAAQTTETPFRQTTPAGAPTAAQPALAGSLQPKADCTEVCPSFCAWSPAFRVGPLAQPCGELGPVVVRCWPRRAHLFQDKLSPETRRLGLEGHDRNNLPEHILAVSLRPFVGLPPLQFLIPGISPSTLAAPHTALVRWNFSCQPDPRNACTTCGQSLFLSPDGRRANGSSVWCGLS